MTTPMLAQIRTRFQNAPASAPAETLLIQGLEAWEGGRHEEAQGLLQRAAVADLRHPEPWYWMGCLYEEQQDPKSAAYCYYLANDMLHFEPALDALQRLGYLSRATHSPRH